MKLEKIVLEVRYKDSGYPFNYRSDLLKKISAGEINKSVDINEGLEIVVSKKRARIIVEAKRWAVEIAAADDLQGALDFLKSSFNRITGSAKWDSVTTRVGLRTIWLEEKTGSFEDLKNNFKSKVLKENLLSQGASDVALCLTFKEGDFNVGYVSGPVNKKELLLKYSFDKNDSFPEVATALDIDFYSNQERHFTSKFFNEFTEKAVNYAKQKVEETNSLLQ